MELCRRTTCKIVAFVILLVQFSYAQELPVNWGPLESKPGNLLEIMPIRSADFYTLRYTGGLFGSYRSTLHNQLTFVTQQKIKPVTETGYGNVDGGIYFANKFHVFLSDRGNGTMTLYSQTLDDALAVSAPSELRASYSDARMGARPNFNIMCSQNRRFLVVYYDIPGKKENRDVYGYTVFDSTFTQVQSGEYALPFDGNLTTINQHHITNEGDYLLVVTEHKDRNDRFFGKDYENFKALHIFKIKENTLKEFNVNLEDKRIDDIMVTSNDQQQVSMTGLFGKGGRSGVEGIFTIMVDLAKDTITNYKYVNFGPDVLRESRTDKQMSKMELRWKKKGEAPQIYSYKLRQINALADGSQIGYIEQYYVRRVTNYDTRTGVTTTNYYYYYMDIVAFKILKDGSFAWTNRIPKSQISLNDNGPYSSFIAFNNDQKAYLIFNDSKKNYDDANYFNQAQKNVYGFNLNPRKNVVAINSIDLNTGAMERKGFFTRKELSAIVVPKMMKVDWINKEVLLYAINRNREKFGIISFK
jgi:hypothetical protein